MPSLLTLLALSAHAEDPDDVTYTVQFHAFCSSASNYCGRGSLFELERIALEKLNETNSVWKPAGVSFRPADPTPVIVHVDTAFENINESKGDSGLPGVLNETLTEQLKTQFAPPNDDHITVFLLPGLTNKCWSAGVDNGGNTAVFCHDNWFGDGGQVFAHEIGHVFRLRHPHTGQDLATHDPVDHDGDDLAGTPDDWFRLEVGETEGDDLDWGETDVKVDHDFCEAVRQPGGADPGSPHPDWCTVSCYRGTGSGKGALQAGVAPDVTNIMSYYGLTGIWPGVDDLTTQGCWGPVVLNGIRYEAFSDDQIARIEETVDTLAPFTEVCGDQGGDRDRDGICDDEDLCPDHPETWADYLAATGLFVPAVIDQDGDTVPDHCDLCPTEYGSGPDMDGDGIGDACDDDVDGDGCGNTSDEDPTSDKDVSAHWVGGECGGAPIFGYAGDDTDGDGTLDCQDPDDDDDGIADNHDGCPDEEGLGCDKPCYEEVQPIWDVCLGSSTCIEAILKFYDRINPDPTLVVDLQGAVGQTLYLDPLAGRTISETVMAMTGDLPAGVRTFDVVAELRDGTRIPVGSWSPARVVVQDQYQGAFVTMTLDARGGWSLSTADHFGDAPNRASRRPGIVAPPRTVELPDVQLTCDE